MTTQDSTRSKRCCPVCQAELVSQQHLFVCKTHGAFVSYGPQLLVRAAESVAQPLPLLPWENYTQEPRATR